MYLIRRFYQRNHPSRVVKRRLSLSEAQAHCRDPETSSTTATGATARKRTKDFGPWFDGYEKEKARK